MKFEQWWEEKKDYFYLNVAKDEAKLIWDTCLEKGDHELTYATKEKIHEIRRTMDGY